MPSSPVETEKCFVFNQLNDYLQMITLLYVLTYHIFSVISIT